MKRVLFKVMSSLIKISRTKTPLAEHKPRERTTLGTFTMNRV